MDFGAEFGSNNCSIRMYVAIIWHEFSPKAVIAAPLGDFGQSLNAFSFYNRFKASVNSLGLTVAVPNFATTRLAAKFAKIALSANDAPQAKHNVKTEITVSPAPVTS